MARPCETCGYYQKMCEHKNRHAGPASFEASLRNGYVLLTGSFPDGHDRHSNTAMHRCGVTDENSLWVNKLGELVTVDKLIGDWWYNPGISRAVTIETLQDLEAARAWEKPHDIAESMWDRATMRTLIDTHKLVVQGMPLALAMSQAARPHTIEAVRSMRNSRGMFYCTRGVGSDRYAALGVMSDDGEKIVAIDGGLLLHEIGRLNGRADEDGWSLHGIPDDSLLAVSFDEAAANPERFYKLSKSGTRYVQGTGKNKRTLTIGIAESYRDPLF